MKPWNISVAVLAAAMALSACSTAGTVSEETGSVETTPVKEEPVTAGKEPVPVTTVMAPYEQTDDGERKILIAYFTWADNTQVEDPSSIDVDATSSASVLPPGNAAKLAGWIQDEVGGDLFSIQVEEPYSSDYDVCLDRAADEKAAGSRPALKTHVENMDDYDVVFLGFPNWWYTLPMPVLTFVDEYDFSGKTVIPFCTHGTGGLAGTIRDLKKALPKTTKVLEPIGVYRPEVNEAQPDIQKWVRGLALS
ncbi:MAG: flavodoxin [Clostridium sp.]|nr:flavodoxin [Clostridium sp.]